MEISAETENMTDFNEILINYVFNTPELWDPKNKYYKDNQLKARKWREITLKMNTTEDVKAKWRSLRDRYNKEKHKEKTTTGQAYLSKRPWAFMQALSFLNNVLESKQTVSNMPDIKEIAASLKPCLPITNENSQNIVKNVDLLPSSSCSNKHYGVEIVELGAGDYYNTETQDTIKKINSTRKNNFLNEEYSTTDSSSNPSRHDESYESDNMKPSITKTVAYNKRKYEVDSDEGSSNTHINSKIKRNKCYNNKMKNTLQESVTDPVDVAILNLAKQKNTDVPLLQQYTPDDLFFLSISKDSQQLESRQRLKFRLKVMDLLVTMLEETTP